MSDATDETGRLIAIMAALRDPKTGCPWDIEQDFASIAPYTIEEAYEVADAIYDRELVSELYSTSGEYDLLAKIYVPEDQDVGHFLAENLFDIPGINRTLTTMTFRAF